MKGTLEERFWAKVARRGPNDCWEWMAGKTTAGYGHIHGKGGAKGKVIYAHRLSWELLNGPILKELCCLHRCDNPGCVNPTHLFLGSQIDNVADKVAKGRQAHGENAGGCKLTSDQVVEIRKEYASGNGTYRQLASKYGVNKAEIGYIVTHKRWAHI